MLFTDRVYISSDFQIEDNTEIEILNHMELTVLLNLYVHIVAAMAIICYGKKKKNEECVESKSERQNRNYGNFTPA